MMKNSTILAALEQTARQLGFEVRYERLNDEEFLIGSGRCRLKGCDMILIEKGLGQEDRIRVLCRELGREDLSGIFLKPFLRRLLGVDEAAVD